MPEADLHIQGTRIYLGAAKAQSVVQTRAMFAVNMGHNRFGGMRCNIMP